MSATKSTSKKVKLSAEVLESREVPAVSNPATYSGLLVIDHRIDGALTRNDTTINVTPYNEVEVIDNGVRFAFPVPTVKGIWYFGGENVDVFAKNAHISGIRCTADGGGGNDVMTTLGSGDTLSGGAGNDYLRHTFLAGPDGGWLIGGLDNDTLQGGDGPDFIFGGAGNDVIYGGGGVDHLYGEAGNDHLDGDAGASSSTKHGGDFIYGEHPYSDIGAGNDTMLGGYGNDYMEGGRGNDRMDGEYGRDTLFGQAGDDVLSGGTDYLRGRKGDGQDDRLSGGTGRDSFDSDPAQRTTYVWVGTQLKVVVENYNRDQPVDLEPWETIR